MNLGSLLAHGKKLSDDVRFALVGTPHFAFCPDSLEADVYPVDFETSLAAGGYDPLDAQGIPVARYLRAAGQYNPTRVAGYALAQFNRFRHQGSDQARDRFLANAQWFARQDTGRFEYAFSLQGLTPPWVSAMAQGQGLSVLARAFRLTGEDRYLTTAFRALEPFRQGLPEGGVRCSLEPGADFLEEHPTPVPLHTLNGFLYAVIGILDLAALYPEAAPPVGFEAILSSLAHLDRWSLPRWSLYDLHQAGGLRNVATVNYHRMHIAQLRYLAARLHDPALADLAQTWEAGYRDPAARLGALAGKIRYRAAHPAILARP